jgi:hypothetical protein
MCGKLRCKALPWLLDPATTAPVPCTVIRGILEDLPEPAKNQGDLTLKLRGLAFNRQAICLPELPGCDD